MLKSALPPEPDTFVMICEKCGLKINPGANPNLSRQLQSDLKRKIRASFPNKEIKALIVSCMDVCPENEVTVSIMTFKGDPTKAEFFTVTPEPIDRASEKIFEKLQSRSKK